MTPIRGLLLAASLAGVLALTGAAPALGQSEPALDEGGHGARAGGVVAEAPGPAFDEAWDEVTRWLSGRMDREGIVGGSLYVTHQGRVVGRFHHGLADAERGWKVDEETIYHWASITKTLTAVALLQLRDRGLLSLDDPAVEYLPELREVHNPFGSMEEITLRQLLSHSAGFRGPTWPWGGAEAWHPHEPSRWEQLVAMMPYTRIHFEPGSRFSYSNPGIIFLGRIIEELSGDPYEVYMEKNVLSPLGLDRAYFDRTPYHLLRHRSNNYVVRDGIPRPLGPDFDTGVTVSNGGLNASAPDLVRWLHFLLGFGSGVEGGPGWPDGVLARSTLREMWEPQVPVSEADSRREWMGLSFFLLERDDRTYVGHTGSQKAYRTFFYVDPETGSGVVGAFNTIGGPDEFRPDADELRVELREKLLQELLPVFPERMTAPDTDPDPGS